MSAFAGLFAACAGEGRAALMPYLMAGLPDPEHSAGLFAAMAEAGADAFEVGLPYADPLMDGPVIQQAGAAALAAGMNLGRGLEIVQQVVSATARPCAVMTYINPILAYGPGRFCEHAARAGASALIVPDLPVDEAELVAAAAGEAGLGLVLFAAPTTTEERLRRVAAAAPPFIYGVAEMGVTGERAHASDRAAGLSRRVRGLTTIPLVLGVGISGPAAARRAAALADGVIVGSALVRRVLEAPSAVAAAESLRVAVAQLAAAVRRP